MDKKSLGEIYVFFFLIIMLSQGYHIDKPFYNYMLKVAHNKTVSNEMGCGPPDDWYCFNAPDAGELIYMYASLYRYTGDTTFIDYINNFAGAPVGGPVVGAATCYPSAPTPLCTEGSDHGHALLTYAKAYSETGIEDYKTKLIEMASQNAEQSAQGDTIGLTYGHNIAYSLVPDTQTAKFMNLPCTECEDSIYLTKLITARYHLHKAGISSALADMKRLADTGTPGVCGPNEGWLCGTASRQMQHVMAYALVYEETTEQKYLDIVKNLLDEKGKESQCNAYEKIYVCRSPGSQGWSMMGYMKGYELFNDETYLNHAMEFAKATNSICGPKKNNFLCSDTHEYMGLGYASVSMLFPAFNNVKISHLRPTMGDTVVFSAKVFDPPKSIELDPFGHIDFSHELSGIKSCECSINNEKLSDNCYNSEEKTVTISSTFVVGKHTLKMECTNEAGRKNSVSENITVYEKGIVLNIDKIESPTTITDINLTVSFKSAENVECQSRLVEDNKNNVWSDMDGDGALEGIAYKNYILGSEGTITAEVKCVSSIAEAITSITFVKDNSAPEFVSDMPEWFNNTAVHVAIKSVTDAFTETAFCNGTIASETLQLQVPKNQKIKWEKELSRGKHDINICCADILGNSQCKSFSTGIDLDPPFFEMTLVPQSENIAQINVKNIKDSFSGIKKCDIYLNDLFFDVKFVNKESNSFSLDLPLTMKKNTILICCEDNAELKICATKKATGPTDSEPTVTLMNPVSTTPAPTPMKRTTPKPIATDEPIVTKEPSIIATPESTPEITKNGGPIQIIATPTLPPEITSEVTKKITLPTITAMPVATIQQATMEPIDSEITEARKMFVRAEEEITSITDENLRLELSNQLDKSRMFLESGESGDSITESQHILAKIKKSKEKKGFVSSKTMIFVLTGVIFIAIFLLLIFSRRKKTIPEPTESNPQYHQYQQQYVQNSIDQNPQNPQNTYDPNQVYYNQQ